MLIALRGTCAQHKIENDRQNDRTYDADKAAAHLDSLAHTSWPLILTIPAIPVPSRRVVLCLTRTVLRQ